MDMVTLLTADGVGFSALQRAEIAEIGTITYPISTTIRFSALQRAEIAEMRFASVEDVEVASFSALQRAEIAEIHAASRIVACTISAFQCSSTSRNC